MNPDTCSLETILLEASRYALTDLFASHREQFYYVSLVTTGLGHPPVLSAWSYEALKRIVVTASDPKLAEYDMKWSSADSPYYCYGQKYFHKVNDMMSKYPPLSKGTLTDIEWQDRLDAMVSVFAKLDKEGVFGKGLDRDRVFINVEVVPPDDGNVERAKMLNPQSVFSWWQREMDEVL